MGIDIDERTRLLVLEHLSELGVGMTVEELVAHFIDFDSLTGPNTTRWSVTDLNTGFTYENGTECASGLGVTSGAVNNCLNGRQKTCAGHRLVRTYKYKKEIREIIKAMR